MMQSADPQHLATHTFGARYYSSQLGRFLTPDWSDSPEAVPYADLSNPQSLNLYSYVLNNPVTATDDDGHQQVAGGYPLPADDCTTDPCQVRAPATPTALATATTAEQIFGDFAGDLAAAAQIASKVVEVLPAVAIATLVIGQTGGDPVLLARQREAAKGQKVPRPGVSGKEGSKDIPSWASGQRPNIGESGRDFAKRLMDQKYGGGYATGPGSEFNKIQKWGDRSFVDPGGH